MKRFFASLPNDVKQTLGSLAVSIALLTGSLLMLSAYMDTIRPEGDSVDAMATVTSEESSESSSP